MSLKIRPVEENDVEVCGKIGYQAHKAISSSHGYPSEQPSEEYAIGLIKMILGNPNSFGVLAERQGKILGSIFLHKFPPSPVAVIGPLTVHPSTEGGEPPLCSLSARSSKKKPRFIFVAPAHILPSNDPRPIAFNSSKDILP